MARYWAVIPAAGSGQRMGTAIPKQYLPLAERTVLEHTLDALLAHASIEGAVLVISPADRWWHALNYRHAKKPIVLAAGGELRQQSVHNGLRALSAHYQAQADDWVLVHDAVRPCLRASDLDKLIAELQADPIGGLLATPVRDTLKRSDASGRSAATVERADLWHALTPQMFRYALLLEALSAALEHGLQLTDEAAAVEALSYRPRLVEGHHDNIKITHPEDLVLANLILQALS